MPPRTLFREFTRQTICTREQSGQQRRVVHTNQSVRLSETWWPNVTDEPRPAMKLGTGEVNALPRPRVLARTGADGVDTLRETSEENLTNLVRRGADQVEQQYDMDNGLFARCPPFFENAGAFLTKNQTLAGMSASMRTAATRNPPESMFRFRPSPRMSREAKPKQHHGNDNSRNRPPNRCRRRSFARNLWFGYFADCNVGAAFAAVILGAR